MSENGMDQETYRIQLEQLRRKAEQYGAQLPTVNGVWVSLPLVRISRVAETYLGQPCYAFKIACFKNGQWAEEAHLSTEQEFLAGFNMRI